MHSAENFFVSLEDGSSENGQGLQSTDIVIIIMYRKLTLEETNTDYEPVFNSIVFATPRCKWSPSVTIFLSNNISYTVTIGVSILIIQKPLQTANLSSFYSIKTYLTTLDNVFLQFSRANHISVTTIGSASIRILWSL